MSSIGIVVYTFAFIAYILYIKLNFQQEYGWGLFDKFIVVILILSLLSPLLIILKTLKFAIRMRKLK